MRHIFFDLMWISQPEGFLISFGMAIICFLFRMLEQIIKILLSLQSGVSPIEYIFLWCNGSTSDSGSEDRGSSPCRKTSQPILSLTLLHAPGSHASQILHVGGFDRLMQAAIQFLGIIKQ